METVKILRELWRHRVVVSALIALSVALGLLLTYRVGPPPESRRYEVGVASARILVDTPKSQFVEVAPLGAETLGQRANILSVLMAEGDVKAIIARRAGLAPRDLVAVSESSADSPSPAGSGKPDGPEVHLLKTRVARDSQGGQLPIVEVETQAPDAAGATRLVTAVVSGVNEYLDSKAAGEQIADRRRLKVSSIGNNPARVELRGPGLLIGVGAGILAFFGGCAMILFVSALSRSWREADASEHTRLGASGPEPRDRRSAEPDPRAEPEPPPRSHDAQPPVWSHPASVVQSPAQPSAPSGQGAGPAAPRSPHNALAIFPSPPERLRPRSRLLSAFTAAKPVPVEVGPGRSTEDTRAPDAGAGR